MDLHPNEARLLKALAKIKNADVGEIAQLSGLDEDSVRKAALWASAKGLVETKTDVTKKYYLTEEGAHWLGKKTLPELELYNEVAAGKKKISELKKSKEFGIGLMWAKKKGFVTINGDSIAPKKQPRDNDDVAALENIGTPEKIGTEKIEELVRRGLVKEKEEKTETVSITDKGVGISKSDAGEKTGKLTPEIIKSGSWRRGGFRAYDASMAVNAAVCGKKHITSVWAEKIRKIFLDMGFKEASGPVVESSFWCFDALYQPQDHPSREMADTFFMKTPSKSKLPEKGIIEAVKDSHEKGIEGSTGWMYKWSEEIAKKPVLRTHTTAVSARSLYGLKPPAKVFCIGRAFRNETVDYKHLPEFTQVEGIVADENVTFRDLLGYLKEFYYRLGFEKIRFRPAYFPYTEMSVEPEVYFEEKKEWVELGGAGIFRPEVTKPLGVDVPVLAWGLSLERPIMLMTGLNDIRNFYFKNDLKLLREARVMI